MLNFDGVESVEHARGGGNNPTVGCEVVADGLRNCVEFLESYGSIKLRTKGNCGWVCIVIHEITHAKKFSQS